MGESVTNAKPSGKRYAILHDFCLTIPYSLANLVTGAAMLFGGPGSQVVAWHLVVAGAATALTSFISFREWKNGGRSILSTAATAVTAGECLS